jgi:UDP:flavonoid glycosyltransferase YjiC (YdhE family)
MAKILAIINAHALAHVSRPLEVAKVLRNRNNEIAFAGHGKYLEIASRDGFETIELPYISVEQVVQAVRSQRLDLLYREEQIADFVHTELALYKRLKPDLVLVDNRPTAITSAEIAGIKTASILNVHMSQYKAIPFHSFRNISGLGAYSPFKYLDQIEIALESFFIDKLVMRDIGKLRRKFGLNKKYGFANEEGVLNLFSDLPEFNPVSVRTDNSHYVGPLTWHNNLPPPRSMRQIEKAKHCIYLTIGSEGFEELIRNVGVFLRDDIAAVIAVGEEKYPINISSHPNVFLEEFVNADLLLPHCDLIICHGGNGTLYQALSHSVPIVGVAMHDEQYYGLKRINALNLGIGLHIKKLRKLGFEFLAQSVLEVLRNDAYRKNARYFQELIRLNGDGAEKAADLIENYLSQ